MEQNLAKGFQAQAGPDDLDHPDLYQIISQLKKFREQLQAGRYADSGWTLARVDAIVEALAQKVRTVYWKLLVSHHFERIPEGIVKLAPFLQRDAFLKNFMIDRHGFVVMVDVDGLQPVSKHLEPVEDENGEDALQWL